MSSPIVSTTYTRTQGKHEPLTSTICIYLRSIRELRIASLETGDGDILGDKLELSDCFEYWGAGNRNRWTVWVRRKSPTLEELRLLGNPNFYSLASEPDVPTLKRPHAEISVPSAEHEANGDNRSRKRQRMERGSVARTSHSGRGSVPLEGGNGEGLQWSRHTSTAFPVIVQDRADIHTDQTSYNTPQSIAAKYTTEGHGRVPGFSVNNVLPAAIAFPDPDPFAQTLTLHTNGERRTGPSELARASQTVQQPKFLAAALSSEVEASDQPAESVRPQLSTLDVTKSSSRSKYKTTTATASNETSALSTTKQVETGTPSYWDRKGLKKSFRRGQESANEHQKIEPRRSIFDIPADETSRGSPPTEDGVSSRRHSRKKLGPQNALHPMSRSPRKQDNIEEGSRTSTEAPKADEMPRPSEKMATSLSVTKNGLSTPPDSMTERPDSTFADKIKQAVAPNKNQKPEKQVLGEMLEKRQREQTKSFERISNTEKSIQEVERLAEKISNGMEEVRKLSIGLQVKPRRENSLTAHIPGKQTAHTRAYSRFASLTSSSHHSLTDRSKDQLKTSDKAHSPTESRPQGAAAKNSNQAEQNLEVKPSAAIEPSASLQTTISEQTAAPQEQRKAGDNYAAERIALGLPNPAQDKEEAQTIPNTYEEFPKVGEQENKEAEPQIVIDEGEEETPATKQSHTKASPEKPACDPEAENVAISPGTNEESNDEKQDIARDTADHEAWVPARTPEPESIENAREPSTKRPSAIPSTPNSQREERRKSTSTAYSRSPARIVPKTSESDSELASDSDSEASGKESDLTGSSSVSGSESSYESSDDHESGDNSESDEASGSENERSSGVEDRENEENGLKARPIALAEEQEVEEDTIVLSTPSLKDTEQAESQLQMESSQNLFLTQPSQLLSQYNDTQKSQITPSRFPSSQPNPLMSKKWTSFSELRNSSQQATPVGRSELSQYKMPIDSKRQSLPSKPFDSSSEESSGSEDDDEDLDELETPIKVNDGLVNSQRLRKSKSGITGLLKRKF